MALLRASGTCKSFGGTLALDNVDFEVGDNEIVGLVGDNGAGKSTLIKILSGVLAPDKGELFFGGEKLREFSVRKVRELGIETVYQERALIPQHTMWRNVYLGREERRFGLLDIKTMKEKTDNLLRGFLGFRSMGVTPDSVVGYLSGGEKQGVVIARALYFNARLIILDEPTVGLSLAETQKVLSFVEEIKKNGKSAIFVTHSINQVYSVADRFVILDRGRVVGEFLKQEVTLDDLIHRLLSLVNVELQVGREG